MAASRQLLLLSDLIAASSRHQYTPWHFLSNVYHVCIECLRTEALLMEFNELAEPQQRRWG